jgi:hypothetical protein
MMDGNELSRLLTRAADDLPVGSPSPALRRRVVRRRRLATSSALAGAAVVLAGGMVVVAQLEPPDRTTPPAVSSATDYVGSQWRLTGVADATTSTAIPASAGATIQFGTDGRIVIHDGTNTLTGRFTRAGDGFEVRDVGTTLVLYGGNDPQRLAAMAALNTLAYGSRDGVTPRSGAAHDTVARTTGTDLVIKAGELRLTFTRTGPASGS